MQHSSLIGHVLRKGLATLLALSSLVGVAEAGGKVVVANDEWTFTSVGIQSAPTAILFAQNIARWFTDGLPGGRFLAYSDNMGLIGTELRTAMLTAGYRWTVSTQVPFDLATLSNYDGVFLGGYAADNDVLRRYVLQGGNVYIMGGTGSSGHLGGAITEAAAWNPFLHSFGLAFDTSYNNISGVIPIHSSHPIFAGVASLYQAVGQSVIDISQVDPSSQILVSYPDPVTGLLQGLYAAGQTAHAVDLSYSAQDPSSPQWAGITGEGNGLAVVGAWTGRRVNPYAGAQLSGARAAGIRTAAYCLLNFDDGAPQGPAHQDGNWQVSRALAAMGAEAQHLQFLAIDVEPAYPLVLNRMARLGRISEAIVAAQAGGLQAVIYTSRPGWRTVASNTNFFSGAGLRLWDSQPDQIPDLGRDNTQPWLPYGGWMRRMGKQYDFNVTLSGVVVDLNVFDPSVFP